MIGIVSRGLGCGQIHNPGIVTRVDAFIPWIVQQMNVTNTNRVFHKALARRLTSKEFQAGFCTGVRALSDVECRKVKGNLKIMFLDMRKVFDPVHLQRA